MMKQFETVLLVLILLPFIVSARVDYFGIDSKIVGDHLDVKMTVYKTSGNFSLGVFGNIENLTSNYNCVLEKNKIICKDLNKSTTLNLEFLLLNSIETKGSEKKVFQQFILPEDVGRVTSILTLPVGAILSNRTDAVYPLNYKTLSNGRNILIYWEIENATSMQPLTFSVYYQSAGGGIDVIFIVKVFVVVIGALVIFFISLFREKHKKTEEIVLEVLDDYEKKIFDLIREKGRIKQREIVSITGFSKARVSRVVKSLSKKGLIKAEKRGRNNILKVKRKMFKTWK